MSREGPPGIVRTSPLWLGPVIGFAATYLTACQLGPWAAAIVSGLCCLAIGLWWARRARELGRSVDHHRGLARIDDLTGLANDRSFREDLRPGSCLALVDVDEFKSYNDTFGHPAGDAVLKEFGTILLSNAGETSRAYRLGGDEFAVIFPDLDRPKARALAERMRAAVESRGWPLRPITASFGLAAIDLIPPGEDPSATFGRADRALYQAKRDGGNRVVG